jgi:hypothetical protein
MPGAPERPAGWTPWDEAVEAAADRLVAWADEKDDSSRYPMPPWSVTEEAIEAFLDECPPDILLAQALTEDEAAWLESAARRASEDETAAMTGARPQLVALAAILKEAEARKKGASEPGEPG